jgi:single-strand DNA-binding protein
MTAQARTPSRTASGRSASRAAEPPVNEVHLVGRLAAPPESRELPSGDVLVSFRLVVGRGAKGPRRGTSGRTPSVDTLDCAVWRTDLQRRAARLDEGDVLELHGSLRRRFWRSGAGTPASRSEVEVLRLRRVSSAPQPAD